MSQCWLCHDVDPWRKVSLPPLPDVNVLHQFYKTPMWHLKSPSISWRVSSIVHLNCNIDWVWIVRKVAHIMPAIHKECHSSRYAEYRWPICIWIGNFYDPVLIVSGWRPAVWHSPLHYQLCHHSPYYCACPPPREEWSAASNECWIPGLFSVTFVSNDRAGPDWPNSDQLEWARGVAGRPDGPLVGRNTNTTPLRCFWLVFRHGSPWLCHFCEFFQYYNLKGGRWVG